MVHFLMSLMDAGFPAGVKRKRPGGAFTLKRMRSAAVAAALLRRARTAFLAVATAARTFLAVVATAGTFLALVAALVVSHVDHFPLVSPVPRHALCRYSKTQGAHRPRCAFAHWGKSVV